MTLSNIDLRSIPQLVRDLWAEPRRYEQNSTLASVVHLATYDLDYYCYILVQTWDYVESKLGDANVRWEYSLWFGGEEPVKLRDFPNAEEGDIPFVASAQVVEEHTNFICGYMAEHNEFPEIK